jgi:transglutaminase-like putative cysteine protease
MFSDHKVKVVIFPVVSVGATIHYRLRREQHTPYIPGHFSDVEGISPFYRVESFEYHLTHDPGIDLRVLALGPKYDLTLPGPIGGRVDPLPTDAPGTVRYRYTWRQADVLPPEENMVALSQFAANVSVSSFKDYASVGLAYQSRARPKAEPSPSIRQMAVDITRGAADTTEKTRRLYHWVSRNIRYVSVVLAHGGFVPNDADTVLQRRFGDCKDHVALLEALLRAVGIESTPALINAGDRYRLHDLPMPLFDHVITYIPELDLYLDPTAGFAPMGTLPASVSGKPVVLTATGVISQTPATHPQRDATHVRSTMRLADNGSVHGQAVMHYQGSHEVESRSWYFSTANRAMKDTVSDVLSWHQETGTGRIHPADAGDLNKPWVLRSEFVLDPVVNLPGPSAMTLPVGLSDGAIRRMRTLRADPQRRFEYGCSAMTYLEEITLEFPSDVKVTRIPLGVKVQHGALRYQATYWLEGQTLHVRRELAVQPSKAACDSRDEVSWEAVLPVLRTDLRAQVFVS